MDNLRLTNHQKLLACTLLLLNLLITGCWDMRELQDRNFVTAVAIDLAEEGQKQGSGDTGLEQFAQDVMQRPYRMSLQIVKLTPSRGESSRTEPANTFVISDTGSSLFEMVRDMLGQSSKGLYFEHLDAIIISESAVRLQGLLPVLDFFLRDAEMRRRIKVFVTSGEARKILEFKPPSGETGGKFLAGIIGNHKKDMHLAGSRTDIGYISQFLDAKCDPMIPRLELADGVMKVNGLALFREDQFAGFIDEHTVQGLKLMSGTLKSAVINIACPDHPWSSIAFELFVHETVLRPAVSANGEIYFTLDIIMWGNLDEVMCARYHHMDEPAFLRKLEQAFAQAIAQNIQHTLRTLQQMQVDSARLCGKLKAYRPQEWKKVKDRWREVYPTVPLQISVNLVIRGIGEHQ